MGRLDLLDAYRDEDYTWSPESPVDAPLTAGDELGDDRPATGLRPTCDCHGEPMGWQRNTQSRSGGYWRCSVRARDYMRQWRANNREQAARNRRRQRLKSEFGLTPEQYDEILAAQHGVCALCERKCATGMRLAVDHNHKTGKVRGLLCGSCNRGLGHFDDDPLLLRAAASYLEARNG